METTTCFILQIENNQWTNFWLIIIIFLFHGEIHFGQIALSIKLIVMYLDLQMSALHAVRWSKSSLSHFIIFFHHKQNKQ